jgi:hypothetical protein
LNSRRDKRVQSQIHQTPSWKKIGSFLPDTKYAIFFTRLMIRVCRAGALVLAVGFWFDGGLFELPTAATFWILLELGREEAQKAQK